MGRLPSAPQLSENPLNLAKEAEKQGKDPADYITENLKSGAITIASEDPDNPKNFPRNLFVWRSNLLGSSAKGMEYFMKHLVGTQNSVMGPDLKESGEKIPQEVKWHEKAPEGKLDLLVTLDFRMSTTALHSDIVLPAASWYEKNDLSTSDSIRLFILFPMRSIPFGVQRTDWRYLQRIG
ncbi:MAG: molybdopterin-dependent oxidoreductase [Bacteroidales bacterium]|nr:molybdopterin-dependent oxidoreductase [Bacteroidales bacterium]